jgi:hypothetical protein
VSASQLDKENATRYAGTIANDPKILNHSAKKIRREPPCFHQSSAR